MEKQVKQEVEIKSKTPSPQIVKINLLMIIGVVALIVIIIGVVMLSLANPSTQKNIFQSTGIKTNTPIPNSPNAEIPQSTPTVTPPYLNDSDMEFAKSTLTTNGSTFVLTSIDDRYANRKVQITFAAPKDFPFYTMNDGMIVFFQSQKDKDFYQNTVEEAPRIKFIDLRYDALVVKSGRDFSLLYGYGYDEHTTLTLTGERVDVLDDGSGVFPMRDLYFKRDVMAYRFRCFYANTDASACDEIVRSSVGVKIIGDKSNPQGDTNVANWKTYIDRKLGFSIKYPSSWRSVENSIEFPEDAGFVLGVGPKEIAEDVVWSVSVYKSTSLDTFLNDYCPSKVICKATQTNTKINGIEAIYVIQTDASTNKETNRFTIFKKDNNLYIPTGEDIEDYKFADFVNSFRLVQ